MKEVRCAINNVRYNVGSHEDHGILAGVAQLWLEGISMIECVSVGLPQFRSRPFPGTEDEFSFADGNSSGTEPPLRKRDGA